MQSIPIPDVTRDISPQISFKTKGDQSAIINILKAEYSEVEKFNEAPARKAQQFLETLDNVVKNKAKPIVTNVSPHFEHKALTEEEKQELIEAHLKKIEEINGEKAKKRKVQRDSKGATVERFGLHINASESEYRPPDVVATGQIKNIIQVVPVKKGPQAGHWAVDKHGKPVLKNGRRLWIDGQHNYPRQRNPYNPEEAVLGTRVMNNNVKLEQCRDEKGELEKDILIDDGARIVALGLKRKVYDRSSQTNIFDDAAKEAAAIIQKKFLNRNISAPISNGAKGREHTVSRDFRGSQN